MGIRYPLAAVVIVGVIVAASPVAGADALTASPGPAAAAATSQPVLGGQPPASSPRPAPPLVDLVKADGTPFDIAAMAGHPTLVFFGYTHCPDVCPATIGELFGVFEAMPESQAVFVSIDPERDTPEFLAQWTAYLPEQFHAVTGTPGAIRRTADAWGIRYARVETSSTAGYTMSHSADVFLLDPHGQLLRSYPFGTPAETMAADIAALPAE
jgi:protein SCO1/2